ncbi:hypothetical protein [Luteimonas vadosa]|uniref:DUF4175 domain-containing protein n=1 Tax=Luteimonas vadosa TaxID=1165507 RepID=A0ABP9E002_9GAMM
MNAAAANRVLTQQADARRRALAITLVVGLPIVLSLSALAGRAGGTSLASICLFVGFACLALAAWRWRSLLDRRWLVRVLHGQRPDLEDSADLLFADVSTLGPLQRLQLARLGRRLEARPPVDLRAPWPWRMIAGSLLLASAMAAVALSWPVGTSTPDVSLMAPPPVPASPESPPRLVAQRLVVRPPAYTALPERATEALDAKVPERSSLHWTLRFDPAPAAAELVFLDGRRVALERERDAWTADARIDAAVLYRIVTDDDRPLQPERLYRLDVVRDQPPRIRVIAPRANLVLRAAGQRQWALQFEASDDHGLAGTGRLRITAAQGTGENITFREETRPLGGSGNRTRKRYATRLDLAALGLSEGDDLVVQFSVTDNRAHGPQEVRSASYILRWPAPAPAMATGLEGLVQTTLPAYFRSQRQIIIDAEALLKQKPKLPADTFVSRSDAIGVDQRLLRLRYGQFLGEESEGAPRRPLMPTNDAQDIAAEREVEAQARVEADAHDDHDDGQPPGSDPQRGFGRAGNLLEEFGHTHDHEEAATLLDPETRTTLRAALDEMWQSELNLRIGKPDAALPYAHRALELIKQVQQASRIYLGRVGSQLPPVDFSRRLSGKRDGISDRRDALARAGRDEDPPTTLWKTLQDASGESSGLDDAIESFARWLRDNPGAGGDSLRLAAAAERVRLDPGCDACRSALRGLLWPLLSPPPAAPQPRQGADRTGQAYLDALQRPVAP